MTIAQQRKKEYYQRDNEMNRIRKMRESQKSMKYIEKCMQILDKIDLDDASTNTSRIFKSQLF